MLLFWGRLHLNTGESVSFLDTAGPVLSILLPIIIVHPLCSAVRNVAICLLQLWWHKTRMLV